MPTYADLWNEQQRALGQLGPSHPRRYTIQKGEYVLDPRTGQFRYEEHWEEEHLMEDEDLALEEPSIVSHALDSGGSGIESSPPMMTALQPTNLQADSHALEYHPSLWVLDTNTLLSCLELLKALFAALLTRNVGFAAGASQQRAPSRSVSTTPSSIKLVLPYIVVSELDGLKKTSRKDDSGSSVAAQARDANKWLLAALQKQKRVPIDESGTNLPQELWPLFVQPSAHYNHSRRSNRSEFLEPDDEIIKFCVDLKQQTTSHVRFCSDDTNARTKAETDGIDSLGMRELAHALKLSFKDVQSSEQKWTLVADALIEQWEYQIGPPPQSHQDHDDAQQGLEPAWQPPFSPRQHQRQLLRQSTADGPAQETPGHSSGSTFYNEIMEVEMDTETQRQSSIEPPAVPMTLPSRISFVDRYSPTSGGRSTNDSIHSPQNIRRSTRTRTPRSPTNLTRPSFAPSPSALDGTAPPGESDQALNPQIDWQELMQQHGSTSNAGRRQRNGRW